MKLGMQVGLGSGHIGYPGPPPPQFSAHICGGQMPARIKIPLSMEVGLGPGDFVLDGDSAPLSKRGGAPQFSAHVEFLALAAKRLDGSR